MKQQTPEFSVYTAQVNLQGSLSSLLAQVSPSAAWVREGFGMVGLGVAASHTAYGTDRFTELAEFWDGLDCAEITVGGAAGGGAGSAADAGESAGWAAGSTPGAAASGEPSTAESSGSVAGSPGTTIGSGAPSTPVAFVSITFAADSEHASTLVVPELLIRHTPETTEVLVTTGETGPRDVVIPRYLARHGLQLTDSGQLSPRGDQPVVATPIPVGAATMKPGVQTEQDYRDAVVAGVAQITAGAVEKLVLGRDVLLRSPAPIHTGSLVSRLACSYPQTWTYRVGEVVGATPEMLVQLRGAEVYSRVLAGTVDSRLSLDEARERLVHNAKHHDEHRLAVDSLVEQLGGVVSSLRTPQGPRILTLPNVHHLATDISGELNASTDGTLPSPLQVVQAAHPTAAVCGTPTRRAGEILADIEGMDRGGWAGPVGWLDKAGNADFGIALRGGMLPEGSHQIRLCAGCGIVAGSLPESELAETQVKLAPMLNALGVEPA